MWVVHHCLAFHGTCAPQSPADLAELLAALVVVFALVVAFFVLLMTRG